eukprot:SAG11_NODE_13675_length_644_cov_0.855046_1_plen_104_part_00
MIHCTFQEKKSLGFGVTEFRRHPDAPTQLVISYVIPGSEAAVAGFRRGFPIHSLQHKNQRPKVWTAGGGDEVVGSAKVVREQLPIADVVSLSTRVAGRALISC